MTTGTFHTDIFRYTTSVNAALQTVGTLTSLSVVGTATNVNCPANRVLRENGRRLFPDANPGVSVLLVGVYDAASGLSGFIDPNSPKFVLVSSDRANYLADPVNPVTGSRDNIGGIIDLPYPASGSNVANTDFSLYSIYRVSTLSGSIKFTATSIPPAGKFVAITCTNDGTGRNIGFSFSNGFVDEGDVTMSNAGNAGKYTFTFMSDGSKLLEVARNIGVITTTGTTGTIEA
jgi:hypothetical protein